MTKGASGSLLPGRGWAGPGAVALCDIRGGGDSGQTSTFLAARPWILALSLFFPCLPPLELLHSVLSTAAAAFHFTGELIASNFFLLLIRIPFH